MIGIKLNNFNINTLYKWKNGELIEVITIFVLYDLFQNSGLSWLIKNSKHLKFYTDQQCGKCMQNGPWYSRTVCYQLSSKKLNMISKRSARIGMNGYVMLMHMEEHIHQGLTMKLCVAADHCQVNHIYTHLNKLVTLLTSLIIVFNILRGIMMK